MGAAGCAHGPAGAARACACQRAMRGTRPVLPRRGAAECALCTATAAALLHSEPRAQGGGAGAAGGAPGARGRLGRECTPGRAYPGACGGHTARVAAGAEEGGARRRRARLRRALLLPSVRPAAALRSEPRTLRPRLSAPLRKQMALRRSGGLGRAWLSLLRARPPQREWRTARCNPLQQMNTPLSVFIKKIEGRAWWLACQMVCNDEYCCINYD